jgi:hypothetical protein
LKKAAVDLAMELRLEVVGCSLIDNISRGELMAKPKPRWLKLDKVSNVRVRVGSTKIEVRLIIPAQNVRFHLKQLEPSK